MKRKMSVLITTDLIENCLGMFWFHQYGNKLALLASQAQEYIVIKARLVFTERRL